MNRWILCSLILLAGAAIFEVGGAWGQESNPIGGPAAGLQLPRVPTPENLGIDDAPKEKLQSAIGLSRSQVLVASLTIFMLAIFVGFEVITKVPPTLHTPLMSGSNAISGITIIGAILVTGVAFSTSSVMGFIALVLATVNVVGGFLVTHRMLSMFNKR